MNPGLRAYSAHMPRIAVVFLIAGIGATAFFAGRASIPQSKRAPVERAESPGGDPEYKVEIDRLSRELAAKREELNQARERIALLESPPEAEAEAAAETDGEGPDPSKPRFVFEKQAKVLDEIDWKVMGESTAHLQPLLGKLTEALREGRNLMEMTEEIGSIQRWNGPLVTQALKMQNSGLSGIGTNGAFTHPSIIVNQVWATLRELGRPLNEQQERALSDLGTRFIDAEARRVAAYDDSTFRAKQMLEEAVLKEDLYSKIDQLLTDAQREALHPAAVRGVMKADFFSSGIIWLQVARPMTFRSRAEFVEKLAPEVVRGERIDPAHSATVKAVVTEWVAGLPDAFIDAPYGAEVERAFLKVDHVIDAARQCLDLRERLARAISDDAATKNLRQGAGVIVPYCRKAE